MTPSGVRTPLDLQAVRPLPRCDHLADRDRAARRSPRGRAPSPRSAPHRGRADRAAPHSAPCASAASRPWRWRPQCRAARARMLAAACRSAWSLASLAAWPAPPPPPRRGADVAASAGAARPRRPVADARHVGRHSVSCRCLSASSARSSRWIDLVASTVAEAGLDFTGFVADDPARVGRGVRRQAAAEERGRRRSRTIDRRALDEVAVDARRRRPAAGSCPRPAPRTAPSSTTSVPAGFSVPAIHCLRAACGVAAGRNQVQRSPASMRAQRMRVHRRRRSPSGSRPPWRCAPPPAW